MGAAVAKLCGGGGSTQKAGRRSRDNLESRPGSECGWRLPRWEVDGVAVRVRQHGLCHVEAPVVSQSTVTQLADAAARNFTEVLAAVKARRALGEQRMDFQEVVERDGCRWDLRHGMSAPPFANLLKELPWKGALDLLLGPEHELLFAGAVVAVGPLGEEPLPSDVRPLRPCEVPSLCTWLTAGIPALRRRAGRFYYEVLLQDDLCGADPQLGWLTESFEPGELSMEGVGDDAHGWAADGVRFKAWHAGAAADASWPRAWQEGDVVGCAVDLDVGFLSFSLNGEWCVDAEMSCGNVVAEQSLFPAVSIRGDFAMHILMEDWHFLPPDPRYEAWAEEGHFRRPARRAQPQGWHQDGAPLFPRSGTGGVALPPHCVNVFLPLTQLREENGATEFVPNSHMEDLGAQVDLSHVVRPEAAAGSVVLFDYRAAHRGGANHSGENRTVLYFTHAVPWFRDHANHRSSRSLFEGLANSMSGAHDGKNHCHPAGSPVDLNKGR